MKGFSLLIVLLFAHPTLAVSQKPELLDARALGMGGALRALAEPVAAARLNPAALGPERGFFSGFTYTTRQNSPLDALSITLVDNVTSPMGGAIQYLRLNGAEEREDFSLGLSAGRRGIWWGFTGRYVHGRNPGEAEWRDVLTGDLGLLFERPSGTRFAVVGYDLIGTSLTFLQRRVAIAVAQSGMKGWNIEVDLVRNLDLDLRDGVDGHIGAEYRSNAWPLALRAGQMWRGETGKDYASVGIGSAFYGVDVGYAVQKARQRSNEYLHVFSVAGSF